jgi:hypothetical protein
MGAALKIHVSWGIHIPKHMVAIIFLFLRRKAQLSIERNEFSPQFLTLTL